MARRASCIAETAELSDTEESQPGTLTRYRDLLASRGIPRVVTSGLISRLPTSMISLALPLLIVGQSGSYARAGVVTACYTIAAGALGPIRGRAVDRAGATLVLMVTGWGQAIALLGIVLVTSGSRSLTWTIVTATCAGALVPPVSPVMRVLWTRSVKPQLRDAAFAFESITIDVLYIAGPALVALLISFAPVDTAVIAAAAFAAIGTTALALAPHSRSWESPSSTSHWLGPLRSSPVRRMLPIGFLIPGSLTAVELGIIAFTTARDQKAFSGILIAAMSVGSIAGGLYWGRRTQPGTPRRQLTFLLAFMSAGMTLLVFPRNIALLGGLLLLVGLALAPSITVEYSLMAAIAPLDEITESFSWINAVGQAGAAVSVAIAGLVATSLHDSGAFVLAASMTAATALFSGFFAPGSDQPHEP